MEFVSVNKELWETACKDSSTKHLAMYNSLMNGEVVEISHNITPSKRTYFYVAAENRGYKAAIRKKIDGTGFLMRWVKRQ